LLGYPKILESRGWAVGWAFNSSAISNGADDAILISSPNYSQPVIIYYLPAKYSFMQSSEFVKQFNYRDSQTCEANSTYIWLIPFSERFVEQQRIRLKNLGYARLTRQDIAGMDVYSRDSCPTKQN